MKIATVLGARPQFIKAAVVSKALIATGEIDEVVIHTGQHYDANMSQVFFDELGMQDPAYHLGIGSGAHGAQTGRMLIATEEVLLAVKPEWVLVYGDTNSTLAGALAAAKLRIPLAHVEAGLRSFNRSMPEELNRILTDHAADTLFAPTELAVRNLCKEGITQGRIRLVGDVMYDAAVYYGPQAEERSGILERLGIEPCKYVLATIHRAENTDNARRLREILLGLSRIAIETPVVFPIHPRTRKALRENEALLKAAERLQLVDPVGYLDMIKLEKNARAVATDSGGIQKEAFFYKVPCVTIRGETEWKELITIGWNRLAPPDDAETVASAVHQALIAAPLAWENPYGDGHAAERIARVLVEQSRTARSVLEKH